MNVKIKVLVILSLMLSLSYSYDLVNFDSDTEVPYSFDGGFTMQVKTTSGNTTLEPLDDLDVHVSVLYKHIPIFTYCKYQDGNECYLWKTDQNGKVNGLFYVHSSYLIGAEYTLEVTIGNVTVQQNFTVLDPITDPSTWGPIWWFRTNLWPVMLTILLILGFGVGIWFFILR